MTDSELAELQAYREQQLLRLLRSMKKRLHSSGWRLGLDRALFRAVFHGPGLDVLEANQLAFLAIQSQCWWHWPEGADQEQKISLDEARRLYG